MSRKDKITYTKVFTMETIHVKIHFLHDARPYIANDELSNIALSFPICALPNIGDILTIEDMQHPDGSFVVAHRDFLMRQDSLYEVTLTVGIEGKI